MKVYCMKKIICVVISITFIFLLSACSSQSDEEAIYSEEEKALAEDIYNFAVNNYEEEDYLYLMAMCLYPSDTGGYLEFIYSSKQLYTGDTKGEPFASLGYTTSFCYEVKDNKIIDEKIDTSLGGLFGSDYRLMWYQDKTKKEKLTSLLKFARAIINPEFQEE